MEGSHGVKFPWPYKAVPYHAVINGVTVITPISRGEITPVKPIFLRPFIEVITNSIYNDRFGAHLVNMGFLFFSPAFF